jgi:hypothetical protein
MGYLDRRALRAGSGWTPLFESYEELVACKAGLDWPTAPETSGRETAEKDDT